MSKPLLALLLLALAISCLQTATPSDEDIIDTLVYSTKIRSKPQDELEKTLQLISIVSICHLPERRARILAALLATPFTMVTNAQKREYSSQAEELHKYGVVFIYLTKMDGGWMILTNKIRDLITDLSVDPEYLGLSDGEKRKKLREWLIENHVIPSRR